MLRRWQFSVRPRAMKRGRTAMLTCSSSLCGGRHVPFPCGEGVLEAILGRPVDLATRDALKRQFRDAILSEAVYAS